MLDRIAKALNLAENAGTPEEADTAMRRAQHLATLAQIDLAVARAHTVSKERREEVVTGHRIRCNPHERRHNRKFFVDLAAAIAEANDCQVLYNGDTGVSLTGFPSDIEVVEALFGILSVQMVSDCDLAIKNGANKVRERTPKLRREEIPDDERRWGDHIGYDRDNNSRGYYAEHEGDYDHRTGKDLPLPPKFRNVPVANEAGEVQYVERLVPQLDGRLYRQNFYEGFIRRTRARLWEAKRAAQKAAGADVEDSSTALALRDKSQEVKDKFDEVLKTLNPRGFYSGAEVSHYDVDARLHGEEAAARARLDDDNAVGASNTKEIG